MLQRQRVCTEPLRPRQKFIGPRRAAIPLSWYGTLHLEPWPLHLMLPAYDEGEAKPSPLSAVFGFDHSARGPRPTTMAPSLVPTSWPHSGAQNEHNRGHLLLKGATWGYQNKARFGAPDLASSVSQPSLTTQRPKPIHGNGSNNTNNKCNAKKKKTVSLTSTRLQRDINASTVSLKRRLEKDREHVQT